MKYLILLLKMKRLKREVNQLHKLMMNLIDLGYKWHLDKVKLTYTNLKRKCILAMCTVNILRRFKILCIICLFICIW